jgi:protein-L-isoaspartate(D-aspartate) O-methyltransferase
METNEELIAHLRRSGVLRSERIADALHAIDRRGFVPRELAAAAYEDQPLPIGEGQTISQPTTVVFMLELLDAQRGQRVLDVGSGSGWTTALLAHLVGDKGDVTGVERVPHLVELGQRRLRELAIENATIRAATDALGDPLHAPFGRILVSASARTLPQPLVGQLAPGGILVTPIGSSVWRIVKTARRTLTEEYPGFAFVPLHH